MATGKGATEEEAKRDAFHNAVEQAVGVYVDATTIAKNDQLIEDVLTYSNAYIKSFTVIRSAIAKGMQTVKIKAMVKVQRLAEKLQSQGIKTVAVDGQSIAAEIVTTKRMKEDGKTLLRKAIGDYPLQFVEFTPSGKFSPGDKGGLDTSIRYSVKMDAYRQYVVSLEKVLKLQAEKSGSDAMPVVRSLCLSYHYFPYSLRATLYGQPRHENKCLFIVGKSFVRKQGGQDRYDSFSVDWYLLKGESASLPYQAWLRSKDLLLRCSLQDDKRIPVAEIVCNPLLARLQYGVMPTTPGGAVATVWSDESMDLAGHACRKDIMIFLPRLLAPGES